MAYFEAHRKLVESSALQRILASPQPLDLSRALIEAAGVDSPFVTLEMVEGLLRSGAAPTPASRAFSSPAGLSGVPTFSLLTEGFSVGAAGREPLEAYGELFASRFRTLSRLLRGRGELAGARPVNELPHSDGTVPVIAMIREVRHSAEKRHVILTIEDDSGSLNVLVPRDSEAARTSFLADEVVGLVVRLPKEKGRIPLVVTALRPDVALSRSPRRAAATSRVVFLSDLHVGSRSFLSDEWGRLVDFLHEKGPEPELAREVRHVVIAGDLVDGIGIYPNQERDLAIGDVFEQYAELGRRLRELPSRLDVVVVPGNHDAVCPAEPQPALPTEI
ncbi:MAG TPA: metallophosphoesterase, partial [Thermoplasmata archaeon]|nr:metallophosphoesterase [Thermoplasmata archaeon]